MHYELQRFKTLSSRTVDRFSRETTSRSHDSHAAERRLILLSLVAGGRKTGGRSREREIQSMLLVFLQTSNYLLGKLKGEGKNVQHVPQSSSNGVVFKTFITNSLLLISQQQWLKLCLLSNWEPEASGSNQSKVLTAFLGRGWSQTRNYRTSVCNFKLLSFQALQNGDVARGKSVKL